jgi:nitric oxide reductase NorD protein
MAEPEDVITEAAHFAASTARSLWLKARAPESGPGLNELRQRLGCFLAMLFPEASEIAAAEAPAPRSLLARLTAGRGTSRAHCGHAFASTDGAVIRLPPTLEGTDDPVALYRLLLLEQAARAQRRTPAWTPAGAGLLRDLFLLAEAAAVDSVLAQIAPGLTQDLAAARTRARAQRSSHGLTAQESEVERLTCALLEAEPGRPPAWVSAGTSPAASLEWAGEESARIQQMGGRYRGVAPVFLWGVPGPATERLPGTLEAPGGARPRTGPKVYHMIRRPRIRPSSPEEDDPSTGIWLPRADDPQESVEDPRGLSRPVDREDYPSAGLGDSLSELPEARLIRSADPVREILASDDPVPRGGSAAPSLPEQPGAAFAYPEWDWRNESYRLPGAVVRERSPALGDPVWSRDVRRRHAPLIRRVRRDFERFRPRRQVLPAQTDGSSVDLDAFVVAAADRKAGGVVRERLYLEDRSIRRDTAVLLLMDVSASTDAWIAGQRRVIDVAKEGLIILLEALSVLGDRYAVLAFRGEGPERVELLPIKRFDESGHAAAVSRRVSGLEPDGYTRVGAAVRHGTALLGREPARHRLLLLFSDGRPNDVDEYEGRYGLEDTRRAFIEARLQGLRPVCLTIDREAPRYAPHMFGKSSYALLRQPERLPEVLSGVVRRLLRS